MSEETRPDDPKKPVPPKPKPPKANAKAGKSKAKAPPRKGPLPDNYGDYAHWPKRFIERRARIERISNPQLRESAKAMCILDECTDPKHVAISNPKLGRAIAELTVYLLHRVFQRTSSALHDAEFEAPTQDSKQKARATKVEARFREAICKAFPPPPGTNMPFDQRKFERAFAQFTAGELALPEPENAPNPDRLALDGIPDGPYYFCFAEAALLFLRLGIEPEFWRRTLPCFIAGGQTFTLNYWDGSARALAAYAGPNLEPIMSSAAMLASLRQHYAVLELPRLLRVHGDLLATALRDEPRLPHPVRTPLEFR